MVQALNFLVRSPNHHPQKAMLETIHSNAAAYSLHCKWKTHHKHLKSIKTRNRMRSYRKSMGTIKLRIAGTRYGWCSAVAQICWGASIFTSSIVVVNFSDLNTDLRRWHCICERNWTTTLLVLISFPPLLFLHRSITSHNTDSQTNPNKQTSCDQNGNHRHKTEYKHCSKHFNNSICCSAKIFAPTNQPYIAWVPCILLHAFCTF